jgi:hypothetical protein
MIMIKNNRLRVRERPHNVNDNLRNYLIQEVAKITFAHILFSQLYY